MNSDRLRTHPYQTNSNYAADFDYQKPFTWDKNDEILTRLDVVDEAFVRGASAGVPIQWLFSTEIEFTIQDISMAHSLPTQSLPVLEDLRKKSCGKIESKLLNKDLCEAEALAMIAAIKDFDVRDLILFEIYDELGDKVEFRFGTQEHGIGYYDNPGVAEIRLTPAPPKQFVQNYHDVIEKMREVAKRYTYLVPSIDRNHVNFSANEMVEGRLLNLIEHSSGDAKATDLVQRIFGGILKAFAEGQQTLMPQLDVTRSVDLGTSRGHVFRIAKNRAEYRAGDGEKDHMADLVLKIMGGAAYGLSLAQQEFSDKDMQLPKLVTCGLFRDVTEAERQGFSQSFYSKRIMDGCVLRKDGGVDLPLGYLAIRKVAIEEELFGCVPRNGFLLSVCGDESVAQDTQLIQLVMNRVKIGPDGTLDLSALRQWPSMPDVLNKPSQSLPAEREIDCAVRHLQDIRCSGTYRTMVSDGYVMSADKTKWVEPVLRFHQSEVMRAVYGDDVVEALTLDLARDLFSMATHVQNKTKPEDLPLEKTHRQIEILVDGMPPERRAAVLDVLVKRMDDVLVWHANHMQNTREIVEDLDGDAYWLGVLQQQEKTAVYYLQPLACVMKDRQKMLPQRTSVFKPKASAVQNLSV